VAYVPDLTEIQSLLAAFRWHGEVIASVVALPVYPNPIRGERYFRTSDNQFIECRYDRRWEGGYYTAPTVGSVYADRADGTTYILSSTGWQPYEEFLAALGNELGGSGAGLTVVADFTAAKAEDTSAYTGGEAMVVMATTTPEAFSIPALYLYDTAFDATLFATQDAAEPAGLVPDNVWAGTKLGGWLNQHYQANTENLLMGARELRFGPADDVILTYFDAGGGFTGFSFSTTPLVSTLGFNFVGQGISIGESGGAPLPRGASSSTQAALTVDSVPAPGLGVAGSDYLWNIFSNLDAGEPVVAGVEVAGFHTQIGDNAADTGGQINGFSANLMSNVGAAVKTAYMVQGTNWDVGLDLGYTPIRLVPVAGGTEVRIWADGAVTGDLWVTTGDGDIQVTSGGALAGGGVDTHYSLTGKENVTNVDGTVVAGQIAFDGSRVPTGTTVQYVVIAAVTAAVTGTVQLYNVTDSEVVSSATVVATSPTKYQNTLTVGAAAGNIKLSDKIYEVRVSVTGSSSADIVYVGQTYLRLEV
jgi:hypothetical protein